MNSVNTAFSASINAADAPNVFVAAASWVQTVLLGPFATSLAVIAIASVGLVMLSGRLKIRRAAAVILGCFILFGAASLAQGLRGAAASFPENDRSSGPLATVEPMASLPPSLVPPTVPVRSTDPYAGASIQR